VKLQHRLCLKALRLHMEHPGKALPEGAAGIGFAFATSGLKAFAASGAASPVRRPCPAIALDWISFLRALTASEMRFLSEDDAWYASQKKTAYKRLWCVLANCIRRLYLRSCRTLPEGFSEANVDKCGKNVDNLWITLEKLLKTCTSTCSLE